MDAAGEDDLAALLKQVRLAFSAAVSASDLDLAFQLQLAEAIQASFAPTPQCRLTLFLIAIASRRPRPFCCLRPRRRHSAGPMDSPRRLLGAPPGLVVGPHFRIFFKGMTSKEVVGPRVRDPGVAVLAAATCGPQGEVVP